MIVFLSLEGQCNKARIAQDERLPGLREKIITLRARKEKTTSNAIGIQNGRGHGTDFVLHLVGREQCSLVEILDCLHATSHYNVSRE